MAKRDSKLFAVLLSSCSPADANVIVTRLAPRSEWSVWGCNFARESCEGWLRDWLFLCGDPKRTVPLFLAASLTFGFVSRGD